MKIDLTSTDYHYTEFKTSEEFERYRNSFKRGEPVLNDNYPALFPCLMMYSYQHIIRNDNGPDEFMNFFFYEGQYTRED